MAEQPKDPSGYNDYQRTLSMVDEILGLQAALAEESARNSPSRIRVDELEEELKALKLSVTWRVGRLVTAPLRFVHERVITPKW